MWPLDGLLDSIGAILGVLERSWAVLAVLGPHGRFLGPYSLIDWGPLASLGNPRGGVQGRPRAPQSAH